MLVLAAPALGFWSRAELGGWNAGAMALVGSRATVGRSGVV